MAAMSQNVGSVNCTWPPKGKNVDILLQYRWAKLKCMHKQSRKEERRNLKFLIRFQCLHAAESRQHEKKHQAFHTGVRVSSFFRPPPPSFVCPTRPL